MSRPRLALLNASYDEDTPRNFRRELDADLVEYDVTEGDLPTDYEVDGCVVTGSRASVYWDEPWIDELIEWVRGGIDRGLPCLGICYGHQILAVALGGSVEGMDEYEIGYRDVERVGDSRLLDGIDGTFTVFTTHQDTVTELPPDAEVIAENDYGIHGFQQGPVYAVQFHPEYDMETAESVTRGKDLDEETKDRVLAGIDEETYAAACEPKRLFDNFVEVVCESSSVPVKE